MPVGNTQTHARMGRIIMTSRSTRFLRNFACTTGEASDAHEVGRYYVVPFWRQAVLATNTHEHFAPLSPARCYVHVRARELLYSLMTEIGMRRHCKAR